MRETGVLAVDPSAKGDTDFDELFDDHFALFAVRLIPDGFLTFS